MEWLYTDIFFVGLISLLLAYILYNLWQKKEARQFLKQIGQRPLAVSSSIIMIFFLLIGLLDSLHFRENNHNNMLSLLDKIMAPIGQIDEKTYSAPLALTLYSMETVVKDDKVYQVHPRLTYPPQTIEREQIIRMLWFKSLLICLSVTAILYMISRLLLPKKPRINKGTFSALLTIFISLLVLYFSYQLSRYFHVLGTGKIGQDIFYFTLKSIRTGLIIGTLTTLFMLPLALALGIAAGYFGGIVDDLIQFIYITLSSIPGVLLITASVLSLQTYISNHPAQFPTLESSSDARLLALCLILGITSWTSLCRILRAEVLKLRTMDFILAAKALGSSALVIIFKHLLPNMMPIVLITVVLDFSFLVLAEAVLSYVGVGVSPMTISWGNMINGARLELARDPIVWWPMAAAFLGMFTLVLASNLLADALRDISDPQGAKLRVV